MRTDNGRKFGRRTAMVRIDEDVVCACRKLAALKGTTMTEFMSAGLRPIVFAALDREIKGLATDRRGSG